MDIVTFITNNKIFEILPSVIVFMLGFYFAVKVADFVTGLTRTWVKQERFKSAIMREGIGRWVGEVTALVILLMVDFCFGLNCYLTGLQLALLIYKELGSIKENLGKLGVNLTDAAGKFIDMLGKGNFKR